jgi:RNA polymerase sigma factor (sigma-70 family)
MSGAPADEARLACAAAAGDGAAFATLYDAYESRIFNFCARLVGNEQDAADATQDAFLKVLQRLPKLADRELNFGAYLFTAARNASYDIIGRRKRAEPVEDIGDVGGRPMSGDERGDAFADPERAALLGTLQEQVRAANDQLPERQREVLALRELEELSYDEIAELMDMNRNSVAQLISRARIRLRDELRGSALASIATSSPECERALPLISMRQDGQLRDEADRAWLAEHLADCPTCKVSVEAIEEAGVSYRAWTPIVVFAWLRRDTIAKAADLVGADWSDVAGHDDDDDGDGDGDGAAGGGGGAAEGRGGRRRRAAAALLGVLLLLILFATLVVGSDDEEKAKAKVTTAEPAAGSTTTTTPATTAAPAAKKAHKKSKHHKKTVQLVVAPGVTVPATVDTNGVTVPAPKPVKRSPTVTGGGGSGNSGAPVQGRPPLTGTDTTPAPPPATTTDTTPTTPPTTTTPPPTTPRGCQGDPVCCRTNPNDPSCIRRPQLSATTTTTTTTRRR